MVMKGIDLCGIVNVMKINSNTIKDIYNRLMDDEITIYE
jgi:hypothetical protein